jgi:hypothetical protein
MPGFMSNSEMLQGFCARYLRKHYAFIFGVDRGGLILASLISTALGFPPCGMLSYEIFFEDETSSRFKAVERDASIDLCLVIAPDEIRGNRLAKENKLPAWAGMLHIPVAAAMPYPYRKNAYLYQRLGIPDDKKILIYAGSLSSWALIDEILAHPNPLPDDWVLVLHDRFGRTAAELQKFAYTESTDRVYFSDITAPSNEDLHTLLHSADMGLALYRPDYESMWTGKNLEHIGMSSGKTNTYLQHGLPVVTTPDEIMTPLIEAHGLGYSVNTVEELFDVLSQHQISREQNQRCVAFFEHHLSLNVHKSRLLDVVARIIEREDEPCRFIDTDSLLNSLRDSLTAEERDVQWTMGDLSRLVDELKETGDDYVIYGDDNIGRTIQAMMPNKFVSFLDFNSSQISADVVYGEVYSPFNLPNMNYDGIIMAIPDYEPELEQLLVGQIGVSNEKIIWCIPRLKNPELA